MGMLLLVRHGQASFGAADYDVLSDLGGEQSRRLGEWLRDHGPAPTAVLHGAMQRQRSTAEALVAAAGWDVEPQVDQRWDEIEHLGVIATYAGLEDGLSAADRELLDSGDMDTRAFQDVFEKATARWGSGAHDDEYDETYLEFVERVRDGLGDASRLAGPGATVVVVTSGGPIAAASAMLIETGHNSPQLSVAWHRLNAVLVNASVTRVVVGSTGARLLSYNEHSFLDQDQVTYR